MHFGINAHLLNFGGSYRAAGISRYIHNLVANLPSALGDDSASVFLWDRSLPPEIVATKLDFRFTSLPTWRPLARILWEQLVAPIEIARRGVDVFHSTAYALPVACFRPAVVTIHDLSFVLMPEALPRGNRAYLSAMTRRAVHQARQVICVSESTRRDVVRLFDVPESRTKVVLHGIEPEYAPRPAEEIARFRLSKGLPDQFVLSVGTLEPRKNLPNLLRAYAIARRRHSVTAPLILGGGKGWGYESVFRLVSELGLEEHVRFPGFLPNSELPLWYNAASLFAYPSRYEGFGMPVLEAMASGTPVLTTTASSMPEVAGDACLLAHPDDVERLAELMGRALQSTDLASDLRQRGLGRASLFSWNRCADETVRIYREARR